MVINSTFSQTNVARHYDELSVLYRGIWGEHLHHGLWLAEEEDRFKACENLTNLILNSLGDISGKNVLDIGCGYGASLRIAEGRGAIATGITVSKQQYEYAKKLSKAKYILGDWLRNDIKDESFDHAYSIECFSHVENKNEFFNQIYKKLRPGGLISMTAWMASENHTLFQKKYLLEPICKEGRLPSLYNSKEIKDTISSQGLELLSYSDVSKQVKRTWSDSIKLFASSITDKEVLSYILNPKTNEKSFVISIVRIYLAFKLNAMKYGVFVARRP